jgi:ubiquinone/menaquinone biosynthesis C-methylase UbiE
MTPLTRHGRGRGHRHVGWLAGTGERLPLADASVDTLTIAFGIRSVHHRKLSFGIACIHFGTRPPVADTPR